MALAHGPFTMTIGLNPTKTAKAKQMASVRARAKMLGRGDRAKAASLQRKASGMGKRAAAQRARSEEAKAACANEDPRRVLFTSALDGDKDARWTCQQLFGDGWRAMAKRELGSV